MRTGRIAVHAKGSLYVASPKSREELFGRGPNCSTLSEKRASKMGMRSSRG